MIGVHIVFSTGEMAERSIAAVLKTVEGQPSQGSNPCLSARQHYHGIFPRDNQFHFSVILFFKYKK